MLNRRLYQLLGDRGYRFVLEYAVADRDPRKVLQRVYRPSRTKIILGALVAQRGRARRKPLPGCTCTWCRCRASEACDQVH